MFEEHYWQQGTHRPKAETEEQRQLLHELETRRERFHPTHAAQPIRTVHVAWGVIKINERFLLILREDKKRATVSNFVFPGGRLNLTDIPGDANDAASLRNLFQLDSRLAAKALDRTLARELAEECGLLPNQYLAHKPQTLPGYQKVEGAGNQHALSQYNIAAYPIQLKDGGELQLLYLEHEVAEQMAWFTLDELLNDSRNDGKRAFVDALKQANGIDPAPFLRKFPDSAALRWQWFKETDAIDIPGAACDPFQIGKTGKETPKAVALEPLEWALLLLLGWHAKHLAITVKTEHLNLLGNGWIKLLSTEAIESAAQLIIRLTKLGLPAPQMSGDSFCRLSINPQCLFFGRNLYCYELPIGDTDQRLILTLADVVTHWGTLQGKRLHFDLPRNMVRVVRAIAAGGDADAPNIKSEDLQRQVRGVFQGIQDIGLRKFVYVSKGRFQLAVAPSEEVLR